MSRSLSPLQAVVLGIVVLAGIALAATGLFAVGSGRWPWSDTLQLRVGFREARGVEAGTRVRVQGIDAGEVSAIFAPAEPGAEVVLQLRLHSKFRNLIRADARAQIRAEGMVGGKVVEIEPGTPGAEPVADNALLASRPTTELADTLTEVALVLKDVRDGKGTIGKLAQDPEVYAALLSLMQQSRDAATAIQQDADALKRLPLVRSYVQDRQALLIRPNCDRHRQVLAATDLFDAGRAVLTDQGKQRLDDVAGWLGGL